MTIKPGAFRFNTDSMKLEIFRGSANYEGTASMAGIGTLAAGQWEEIQATSPEVQTGGTRGLFAGGDTPSPTMDYVNVDTTGNAIDFGNLTYSAGFINKGGAASRVRGLFQGGRSAINTINQALCHGASDADSLRNLYRRIYADVPELPPMPLGSEIPSVGQMTTNLVSYDVLLKKGGAANA